MTLITCRWCGNLEIINKNTDANTRRGKEHCTWTHGARLQPPLCHHSGVTATAHVATRCSLLCNQPRNELYVSFSLSLCPPFLSWRRVRISKMLHPTSLLAYFQQVFTTNTASQKSQRLKIRVQPHSQKTGLFNRHCIKMEMPNDTV